MELAACAAHWTFHESNNAETELRTGDGIHCKYEQSPAVEFKFYESDCQGRFSPSLIAFRFSPLQSAPTDRFATIVRTRGWAEQPYASDSSSVSPLIFIETISSSAVDHRQRCHMVLSETRARH